MNENQKSNLHIVIYCIVIAVVIVAGWFLFRDIRSDGGRADDVREQYEQLGARLDDVTKQLRAIELGIESSKATADRIEQSVDRASESVDQLERSNTAATESAERIKAADSIAKESVDRAAEINDRNNDIIRDGQQRIATSKEILRSIRERTPKN